METATSACPLRIVGADPPVDSGRNRQAVLARKVGATIDMSEDIDLLDAIFTRPLDPLGCLADGRVSGTGRVSTWSADGRTAFNEDHRNVAIGGLYGRVSIC